MSDYIRALFELATSPDALGWSPQQFWKSTAIELRMSTDGLNKSRDTGPKIAPERVQYLAKLHANSKSIKKIKGVN